MRYCPACGSHYGDETVACAHDCGPTVELDELLGEVIDGRYLVEERIGEGAMGIVYRGSHTALEKPVAIKVLRAALARSERLEERFFREARAASSIGHPNICDVSDFGRLKDGSVYFVMEHLVGEPLSALIARGRMPKEQIAHVVRQVASATGAAHEVGIVHRDLKPDNIFVTSRATEPLAIKVLDFGVAKVADADKKLTRTGRFCGTPRYLSPEQAAGRPVDGRSDVYALGIVAYEMATGRPPFSEYGDAPTLLRAHLVETPPPPSAVVPEGDFSLLEPVIMKALAKKPEDRFQDMAAMARALDPLDPTARPSALSWTDSSLVMPPEEPIARRSVAAMVGAAGILAAAAVAATLIVVGAGGEEPAVANGPPPSAERAPSSLEAPRASSADPSPTRPAPAPTNLVTLQSTPDGAIVSEGDVALGNTPMAIERPPAGTTLRLTFSLPGYADALLHVGPDSADTRRVELAPAPEPRVATRPPRVDVRRGVEPDTAPVREPAPPPPPTPMRRSDTLDPWEVEGDAPPRR